MSDSQHSNMKKPSAARSIAEWTTLGFSVLIVGGLAAYLGWDAMQPRSNVVKIESRIDWKQVQQRDRKWVLPIEIHNADRQNLSEVHLQVTWQENKKEQSRDVSFDYVAQGSWQRVYLWFGSDPRGLKVRAEPSFYLVH